jgi:hypothetical protein
MLTKALENFQFVSDMILVTFICSLHDEKAGGIEEDSNFFNLHSLLGWVTLRTAKGLVIWLFYFTLKAGGACSDAGEGLFRLMQTPLAFISVEVSSSDEAEALS